MSGTRYTTTDRHSAIELAASGLNPRRIASELNISYSTIYRWLYPSYAQKSRDLSRAAKRRRHGICEQCGKETSYNSRGGVGVSRLCNGCASAKRGLDRTVWNRERIIEAIQWWASVYGEPPAAPDFDVYRCERLQDWRRAERTETHHQNGDIPSFSHVVSRFGTWNAALVAAGFSVRPSHGGGGNNLRRRTYA